eukprot:1192682-Prorocentrum_minimum.AAC.2
MRTNNNTKADLREAEAENIANPISDHFSRVCGRSLFLSKLTKVVSISCVYCALYCLDTSF